MIDCIYCIRRAERALERKPAHPDFTICGYPDERWFPLGVIRFCPPQVLFLMENISLLRDGKYPLRPTGYTDIDPAIIVVPRTTSSQQTILDLAAEIDARLSSVPGIQRKLFEVEIQEQLELSPYSWTVLNYVSGWPRKTMSFSKWQQQKERRRSLAK